MRYLVTTKQPSIPDFLGWLWSLITLKSRIQQENEIAQALASRLEGVVTSSNELTQDDHRRFHDDYQSYSYETVENISEQSPDSEIRASLAKALLRLPEIECSVYSVTLNQQSYNFIGDEKAAKLISRLLQNQTEIAFELPQ